MPQPDPWAAGARLLLRHPLPTSVHGDVVAAGTAVECLGPHPDDNAEIRVAVAGDIFTLPFWWLTPAADSSPQITIARDLLAEIYLNAPQHLAARLENRYGIHTLDRYITASATSARIESRARNAGSVTNAATIR